MLETLLGGVMGGIFRVIPEVLKWMDRKAERKHELSMQDKQLDFEKLHGQQKIEEVGAQSQREWNVGALDALKTSIEAQAKHSGIKWIDGFSSLMRPLITFQWVIFLYPAVIVASFFIAVQNGVPALQALVGVFGSPEKTLVAGIVNFWFLGRVFDKVKL